MEPLPAAPDTDPSIGETEEEKNSPIFQITHACNELNKEYIECTDRYYATKLSTRMTGPRTLYHISQM